MIEVDIDKIKISNIGIKETNPEKEACIKKLIQEHGQIYPLIVIELSPCNRPLLIDGHIQYKILKELNFTKVFIVPIKIKGSAKQKYLELNFTKLDIHAIEAIKYLKEVNLDDHALPFDKKRITDLIAMLDYDYKKHREESSEAHSLWDENDEVKREYE